MEQEILKLEDELYNRQFECYIGRIYSYFTFKLSQLNQDYLEGKDIPQRLMIKYMDEGLNHRTSKKLEKDYQQVLIELKRMGSIDMNEVDGTWHLTVVARPSFLSHEIELMYHEYFYQKQTAILPVSDVDKLKIYTFKRYCRKCQEQMNIYTPIYSLDTGEVINYDHRQRQYQYHLLGCNEQIDAHIAKQIPTIEKKFMNHINETYYLNTCDCGAVYGIDYLYHDVNTLVNQEIVISEYNQETRR